MLDNEGYRHTLRLCNRLLIAFSWQQGFQERALILRFYGHKLPILLIIRCIWFLKIAQYSFVTRKKKSLGGWHCVSRLWIDHADNYITSIIYIIMDFNIYLYMRVCMCVCVWRCIMIVQVQWETRYCRAAVVMAVRNTMWGFNYAFIFRASRQFLKSKGVWDNLSKPACLLTNNKTYVFFILVIVSSSNYRLSLPPYVLAVGPRSTLIRQTSGQEMAASSCEIWLWGWGHYFIWQLMVVTVRRLY